MSNYYNDQWRLPNEENKSKVSNYSMDFANSRVNLGTSLDLGINSTISLWLNKDDTTSSVAISESSYQYGYLMYLGGKIYIYIGSISKSYDYSMVVGQWYHLVIVRQGTSIEVFLNNTSLGTQTGFGTSVNTKIAGFGAKTDGTFPFNGKLDGISLFNYALSSSQVTTLYGSSSTGIGNPMAISGGGKPVAYYPLGDQDAFNGSNYLVPNSSLKDYVFDFANSNIEVDSIGSLFSGITNFSFSGWFNLTSFGSQQVFNILEGSNWKFGINTFNNQLRFNINPSVAYIANLQNITSTNTWFHYAGVFDGSGASDTDRLKLYINGQPQTVTYYSTTPTSFPTLLSTADISIGGSLSPFNGMTGKASNIQLWDTSLSSTEIETLYNNGSPYTGTQPQNSNLQGWYKLNASATFDSSTNTWTIPDDSTNSNDGTSSGMTQANLVQSDLSFTSGYSPYALDFDTASVDYIQINNGSSLTNGFSELTVSIWANFASVPTNRVLGLASKDNTNERSFDLRYIQNTGVNFLVSTDGVNSAATTYYPKASISAGQWYHFVGVYDGSNVLLYVNGAPIGSPTALTGSLQNTTSEFFIGKRGFGTTNTGFDGKLSNVAVFNTGLSQSQVTELYSEGIPQNLLNHSAASSLVSWWQLGSNSSFNTNWTVLDEKGSNNGTSVNMTEADIVDGVGSYANGLSSGMGGDEVIGDAPYSTANALSVNMDVEDRVTDTPS